jgi:hypothetical protein
VCLNGANKVREDGKSNTNIVDFLFGRPHSSAAHGKLQDMDGISLL